jgi:hypothetical protein
VPKNRLNSFSIYIAIIQPRPKPAPESVPAAPSSGYVDWNNTAADIVQIERPAVFLPTKNPIGSVRWKLLLVGVQDRTELWDYRNGGFTGLRFQRTITVVIVLSDNLALDLDLRTIIIRPLETP